MTRRQPTDLAVSIRQRLLNRARERGEDFQLVLIQYATERLLDVSVDELLVAHETQVPVGDAVVIQPRDRLSDRHLVEVPNEEAMRNDPDAHAPSVPRRRIPCAAPSIGRTVLKLSLCHGETMDAVILARHQLPLRKAVLNFGIEFVNRHSTPLGDNLPHSLIEVGANPSRSTPRTNSAIVGAPLAAESRTAASQVSQTVAFTRSDRIVTLAVFGRWGMSGEHHERAKRGGSRRR